MAVQYQQDVNFLYRKRKRVRKSTGAVSHFTYTEPRTIAGHNTVRPEPSSRPKPSDPEANPTWHGPYHRYVGNAGIRTWDTTKDSRFYYYYDTHFDESMPYEPASLPDISGGNTEHLLALRDTKIVVNSMLAELDKTADGFTSIAKKLGKIARRVRRVKSDVLRGKFRNLKPDLRERDRFAWTDLAETHLAIEYGIKPVCSDLYQIHTKLNQFNLGRRRRKQTTHRENLSVTQSGFVWEGDGRKKFVTYFNVEPKPTQWDIGDPSEWIWENIPFSFVVDWFIPIGDQLSASYATRGLSHISTTITRTRKLEPRVPQTVQGSWIQQPSGSVSDYFRWTASDFVVPDNLTLSPGLSAKRAANAAALVTAVGSRRRFAR